jgi:hypothetical protein
MTVEDYGQQIRKIAEEYRSITGDSLFSGVSHPTPSTATYMFDRKNLYSGDEALGYARSRLAEVKPV